MLRIRNRIRSASTQHIYAIDISQDGSLVVGAGNAGVLDIWGLTNEGFEVATDVEGGSSTLSPPQNKVSALKVMPDGEHFLSANGYKSIKLRDITTGEVVHDFGSESTIYTRAFAVADKHLIVSAHNDGIFRVWEGKTYKPSKLLQRKNREDEEHAVASAVAITPDSQYLVGADHLNRIGLWDLSSGEHIRDFVSKTNTPRLGCDSVVALL